MLRRVRTLAATSLTLVLAAPLSGGAQPGPGWLDAYREPATRLIDAALADDHAWQRLAELGDTFGARLSGSPNLEAAIQWAARTMEQDGLEQVRTEPVMVPVWVRGRESAEILEPVVRPLVMLGLGGSVATPPDGLIADALVVTSFDELDARADEVKGRIVVFNVPYTSYGPTVQYRLHGASRAARHGAVAMLVRSIGPMGLRTPHTGTLVYAPDSPAIPAAAIAAEDAEMLHRIQKRGQRLPIRLHMEAKYLPDAESANVVAELVGREFPNEVVVIGCHIDSWDVGTGASDDGGGCIAVWEAARLMKQLDLRPRRTVRVVLYTNEENGLRGGLAYRDRHLAQLADHVMMLESDIGVFAPAGFGFSGSDGARAIVTEIATLLRGIGADRIGPSGGGADIGPSVEAGRMPAMSLEVGGNYFLVHHTPADLVERIEPAEIAKCVAAIAVMTYVVADLPERLDRQ